MAKMIEIDQCLLQDNLDNMHTAVMQTMDDIISTMMVDATECAIKGEKFQPKGVIIKVDNGDEPKKSSKKPTSDILKGILEIMEETLKDKPSEKAVDKLISDLDELFSKQK